jgi:hypothetical protein
MFMYPSALAALLGFSLLGCGDAAAIPTSPLDDEVCEHSESFVCPSDHYLRAKNKRCEDNNLYGCRFHTEPPGVTQFNCGLMSGVYQCRVYPTGPYISYSYYATPGLSLSDPGPTYSNRVSVSCDHPGTPGVVTVTVTSPFGISSSESFEIPCGQPWD